MITTLGWAAVAAAVAWRRSDWRVAWGLAAITSVPVAWLGTEDSAAPFALLVVTTVWLASVCRLGALAGELVPGTGRVALSGVLVAGVLALDLAAAVTNGTLGGVFDSLSVAGALGRAASGSLDVGTLITTAAPGFAADAASRWARSRRDGATDPNAPLRLALALVLTILGDAAVAPLPPLLDTSASGMWSLHEGTTEALHRLDRPLMLSWASVGDMDKKNRSTVRVFDRLAEGLARRAHTPLTAQRLEPDGSAQLLQEAGREVPNGSWQALEVRALDRAELLLPAPSAEDLQSAIAQSLWRLGTVGPAKRVHIVGDLPPGVTTGRPATRADDGGSLPSDTSLVVVAPVAGGHAPDALRTLDDHVMKGGDLVVIYGKPLPERPRVGVPLTNPWGFHADGAFDGGLATAASPEWETTGFHGLEVPPGTPPITGPEGLAQPVALVGAQAVAMAMVGSVPSGYTPPGEEPRQSQGAVRVFMLSYPLLAANPSLLPRAVDWALDESELSAMRPRRHPTMPRGRAMTLLLALLPGVGAGLARSARGEGV